MISEFYAVTVPTDHGDCTIYVEIKEKENFEKKVMDALRERGAPLLPEITPKDWKSEEIKEDEYRGNTLDYIIHEGQRAHRDEDGEVTVLTYYFCHYIPEEHRKHFLECHNLRYNYRGPGYFFDDVPQLHDVGHMFTIVYQRSARDI